MASPRHGDVSLAAGRHPLVAFEYANTANREAHVPSAAPITHAGTLLPLHVGCLARQTDDSTYWLLTDDSPITWLQVQTGPAAGIDTDAIHDNVAGEIAAITAKATPAGADLVVIEDSAAANVKKSTTAAAIAASGPPAAHTHTHASTTGQTANDHHNQIHALGGADHTSATLAQLNALVSDADVPALAGQLGGTAASPDVRGIRETGSPTLLPIGAISTSQILIRSGGSIIGASDLSVPGNLSYTGSFTGGDGLVLANSATPSIAGRNLFLTGGTTQITNFLDFLNGQIISIVAQHSITITHGTQIKLSGNTNFTMISGNTLTLVRFIGAWWEIGRVGDRGDEGLVLPNSATPSVTGSNYFAIRDNTTRTNFTDFFIGQIIRLFMDTPGTTKIVNSSSVLLKGNIDFDMVLGDSLTLTRFLGAWIEVGRMHRLIETGAERTLASSATPSVVTGGPRLSHWKTSGTTNITSFSGGTAGQIIVVRSDDATGVLTLVHSTNTLDLAGDRNFSMDFDDTCVLIHKDGNFHEIARSSKFTGGATEVITLDNTGTPTLGNKSNPVTVCTTSGTTNITNIAGGRNGQTVKVFHAHTIIYEENSNFDLFLGINTSVAAGNTIEFLRVAGVWKEVKYI